MLVIMLDQAEIVKNVYVRIRALRPSEDIIVLEPLTNPCAGSCN